MGLFSFAKKMWSGIKKVGTSIFHGAKKIYPHAKSIIDKAKPLIAQMGPRGAAIAGGIDTAENIGSEIQSAVKKGKRKKDSIMNKIGGYTKKAKGYKSKMTNVVNMAENALNALGLQKRPSLLSFIK